MTDITKIAKLPEGESATVGHAWTYIAQVPCPECGGGPQWITTPPCKRCAPGWKVSAILATGIVTAACDVIVVETAAARSWSRPFRPYLWQCEGSLWARTHPHNEMRDLSDQLALGADPQRGEVWVVLDVTVLDEPQTTKPCGGRCKCTDPEKFAWMRCDGLGNVPVSGPDGWRADA